ncbi:tRNA 5-methoxyuridine(34)/uridine 5-oxyacetic acid(34) synthase CmoB [Aliidiomarina soli]|uniref:tRNA U34 carboxymethyltransferase n=1 Tax=Aliidiomarina soli TaxID=1928574 RepID=A0A432WD00_9GAMM|nr:tRNA 5-methoxyuridine(34)/uridine 5-oxyacetic acid(34) synthase CmoB [Aliidiomarina soli]RUO30275.1 tRNA 5-methoxyuridine(34)/uridine 5-oxyacetic acid(34) synthase CmoB [Aliidiomarina soli]
MIDYGPFYARLATSPLAPWLRTLPAEVHRWQTEQLHGDFAKWLKTLNTLPDATASSVSLDAVVRFGEPDDLSSGQRAKLEALLKQFKPWRKGPFDLFGLNIDTEWRSDLKWQRVLPHLDDLAGRYVLDIGCGSGYHLWRMKQAGAKMAIGIDPSQLFLMQFKAIQKYAPINLANDVELLPLGVDELPTLQVFDTVFTMGVLYHRRSPVDFLKQCWQQLRPGGQLVLETLVVEGDKYTVLMPENRYAQMRNVWFLPSTDALCLWLRRSGFKDIEVVDLNTTTTEEQRPTEWMENQSLCDFLDPNDRSKTIEGYPAPLRAVITARRI